jgi:hypothetical protein
MGCTITLEDNGFEKTNNYENVKEATYIATCIQIVDLGTQKNFFFGKDKPDAKKPAPEYKKEIMLVFELDELMQDGRPFTINATYEKTFYKTDRSTAKNSLLYLLEKWRGKEFTAEELKRFDMSNVLGKACSMTIKLKAPDAKGKQWPVIEAVSVLRKQTDAPTPTNPLVDFGIEDMRNPEIFTLLWPWVQNKVKESIEGHAYFEGIEESEAF